MNFYGLPRFFAEFNAKNRGVFTMVDGSLRKGAAESLREYRLGDERMRKNEELTSREENFCRAFVCSREPRASAAKAGFALNPERAAIKLLNSRKIRERIAQLEQERQARVAEVTDGYRRIAFGSVADAVRLILLDEPPEEAELEKMDLTMVSDIKRPKGGGLEVKFFDRLKALDRLCELSNAVGENEGSDFFAALNKSARALHSEEDEGE